MSSSWRSQSNFIRLSTTCKIWSLRKIKRKKRVDIYIWMLNTISFQIQNYLWKNRRHKELQSTIKKKWHETCSFLWIWSLKGSSFILLKRLRVTFSFLFSILFNRTIKQLLQICNGQHTGYLKLRHFYILQHYYRTQPHMLQMPSQCFWNTTASLKRDK